MTRKEFIYRALIQIYGDVPSDEANINVNLVNFWLQDAIAIAAKKNYTDSYQIDGVAYVNNSFYTTFKGLTLAQDEYGIWKITLPQIPLGIGYNEGVSQVVLKDTFTKDISYTVVMITEQQRSYSKGMREIPNKLIGWMEGKYVYIITPFIGVYNLTASVTMISGGDSADLSSELNVPPDYFPTMVDYIKQQLQFQRAQPQDVTNDGEDFIRTT